MQLNRYRGSSKLPILIVILILCAAGVFVKKYLLKGTETQVESTPAAAPQVAAAPSIPSVPPTPRGSAIYLQANETKGFSYAGLTTRELFRQAVLIAGRDDLGLATRDGSLREWAKNTPSQDTLEMTFDQLDITISDVQAPGSIRWQMTCPASDPFPHYADLISTVEQLSRGDLLKALESAGWSGHANPIKDGAPASADAEACVQDMEEITQFTALRETHALIRKDGESLPRLGILVRAYANLGLLTRYHWSAEYAVYTARALLYAQRMVAMHPSSAFALWHRAYARAMAGCINDALKDLAAAEQFPDETPPPWVALVQNYCNYQPTALAQLGDANPTLAPQARFLAYWAMWPSNCLAAENKLAKAAYAANPKCLLVIDSLLSTNGPGLANELVELGPKVFGQTLAQRLEYLPEFPQKIKDEIDHLKTAGGNPTGRAQISDELIKFASPDHDTIHDTMEPSLAAVGRLMQETTFAQTRWSASFIAVEQYADASDFVKANRVLYKEHPFSRVIDFYGVQHTANRATLQKTLKRPGRTNQILTVHETPLYWLDSEYQPDGPDTAQHDSMWMTQNIDYSASDLGDMYRFMGNRPDDNYSAHILMHLGEASPNSPILAEAAIDAHWDVSKAPQLEGTFGDYPNVLMSIGHQYVLMKRWPDAERCFHKYIALSPDLAGYKALAQSYHDRKDDADWLKTWNSFLTDTPDEGLDHGQAEVKIANYFMEEGDYNMAARYADAAAGTGAAWAMLCDADAHTGLGDFAGAQKQLEDEASSYGDSPYDEFCWCEHTGHGDAAAIKANLEQYYVTKSASLTDEDLIDEGCLQLSESKKTDAMATFQLRLHEYPGPLSAAHVILLADELHDTTTRDAMLAQIPSLPGGSDTPMGKFAAFLGGACQTEPTMKDADQQLEPLFSDEDTNDRMVICTLWALYLDDHGHSDQAVAYLRRGAAIKGAASERLVCDAVLRAHHLDPWALDTASHPHAAATQ